VPVWSSQGALSGTGQEHEPAAGDVCHVEPVDGAQANIAGVAGMSAPAARAKARKQAQQAQQGQKGEKSAAHPVPVSPCEHSCINSRCGGGYADHP